MLLLLVVPPSSQSSNQGCLHNYRQHHNKSTRPTTQASKTTAQASSCPAYRGLCHPGTLLLLHPTAVAGWPCGQHLRQQQHMRFSSQPPQHCLMG